MEGFAIKNGISPRIYEMGKKLGIFQALIKMTDSFRNMYYHFKQFD